MISVNERFIGRSSSCVVATARQPPWARFVAYSVWLRRLLEAAQQVKLPGDDPQYFDFPLQTQVTEFQRRHGLNPDGVVGKQTMIQLNNYSDRKVPLLLAESS